MSASRDESSVSRYKGKCTLGHSSDVMTIIYTKHVYNNDTLSSLSTK